MSEPELLARFRHDRVSWLEICTECGREVFAGVEHLVDEKNRPFCDKACAKRFARKEKG